MNYTVCTEERDAASTIWNVLTAFGYKDAKFDDRDIEGGACERIIREDNAEITAVITLNNSKAKVESIAMSVEAMTALEIETLKLSVSGDGLKELLYLYSIDEYCTIKDGDFAVQGKADGKTLFTACEINGAVVVKYDLQKIAEIIKGSIPIPNKTVIYPEKDGDGIAYEIAYTLRLFGCMAIMYVSGGSISDCEKDAKNIGASDLIRVYPNGKLQIKELATGEITETDYETFIGYYDEFAEDDDDECDCGHEHHHGGCDCGHH